MGSFVACPYRISEYMDLTPAEVVGHTCYNFIHVEDLENLRQSHEDCESWQNPSLENYAEPVEMYFVLLWSAPSAAFIMNCQTHYGLLFSPPLSFPVIHHSFNLLLPVLRKGQVVTGYYRWLQRRGGYLWIQSTATVSINHKAPHERNVIWVNFVLRSVQPLQSQKSAPRDCGHELSLNMQAGTILCSEILWRDRWWNGVFHSLQLMRKLMRILTKLGHQSKTHYRSLLQLIIIESHLNITDSCNLKKEFKM